MSGIRLIGSNYGLIDSLETLDETLLSRQNIRPGIPPCFRSIDELEFNRFSMCPSRVKLNRATYSCKHFVSIIKILQQHRDLRFVRSPRKNSKSALLQLGGNAQNSPRKKLPETPLHALHGIKSVALSMKIMHGVESGGETT